MQIDAPLRIAIESALRQVCNDRNVRPDPVRLAAIQSQIEKRIAADEPHDLVFAEETRTLK